MSCSRGLSVEIAAPQWSGIRVTDQKRTAQKGQRQREHWDRAVVATVSSSRKDMDLTQEELAERMGWSREVLSNIEQGRRAVSVSDLILIARALDLDPETLFRRVLRW
jgi:DNA-binding XRE family transcriptional regulator